MPDDKIDRALKRLENCEVKVTIRGGKIVKIPCQDVTLPLKDGIQDFKKIPADIIEE